jgi:CelD/BcsL family acetyltransferase involved in cellulose biosynthesis
MLTVRLTEALAADDVSLIDFGKGKMQYKESLKTGDLLVAEGTVTQRSPLGAAHWARQAPQAWAIRQVRTHPSLFRAADAVLRRGAQVRGQLTSRAGG